MRLGQNSDFRSSTIRFCPSCNLIGSYPPPSAEKLADFYDGEYSRTHSWRLKPDALEFYDRRAEIQLEFILANGGTAISDFGMLDIGCGVGSLLVAAEKHGADVLGYEADSSASRIARSRLGKGHVVPSLFDVRQQITSGLTRRPPPPILPKRSKRA
jgi:2-polyprenyl-3-methyl-5-hydroxy-6-metoxy-1,4-benzoquinol methylase